MDSINGYYKCNICNKIYSSYKSLWNHNKQFHDIINNNNKSLDKSNQSIDMSNQSIDVLKEKIYKCNYCNNIYKHAQSKHKHQNICKNKNINNELVELKNKNLELEISLNEIKELLISSKIHHKTLKKINKQLNNNTTNNITNNNINNNVTINNTINLVGLGSENLSDILNKKEKLNILKNMYGSLSKIVKYVHFNDKFPQFKTILITNMQNNIAYKYDEDENRFLTIQKDELLNDLLSIRLDDLINKNL